MYNVGNYGTHNFGNYWICNVGNYWNYNVGVYWMCKVETTGCTTSVNTVSKTTADTGITGSINYWMFNVTTGCTALVLMDV